jgi:hypothetical protein
MREESCAIFPVRSGVPMIGLGLFLILAAAVTWFIGAGPDLVIPVTLIFGAFGIFLIWLGLTK